MRRVCFRSAVVLAAIALFTASPSSQGRRAGRLDVEQLNGREVAAREVLVKPRGPVAPGLAQIGSSVDAEMIEHLGRFGLIRIRSRSLGTAALVAAFANRPDVEYVEPNYVVHTFDPPNDPGYPSLWGLKNLGQAVNGGAPGTPGSDIDAEPAWDLTLGSTGNVVAILDTGINYSHEDLAANVWSAPSPFTVTIGGAAITCQAGTHGFNAITRTCDPMDDHYHGTHVAGTIGAVGNNGLGVAGVNRVASMMGLKFLDANGSGTIGDAIALMEFAMQAKAAFAATGGANIRVLSNSWGGGPFSQAMLDAINAANQHDMLFVAAAGNNGFPNDIFPTYPASYAAPNVIAVAATTNTDDRAFFSNYGAKTVHLAAPGVDISSTVPGGYAYLSGTSMAAPHVSGAAALTLSYCALNTAQLKATIVGSVDTVPSLASVTMTGGRLNAKRALKSCSSPPEIPTNVVALGGDKLVKVSWSAAENAFGYRVKRSTVAGGPYALVAEVNGLQYTDTAVVNGTTYFYVVSATNVLGESADSAEVNAIPKTPADLGIYSLTVPSTAAPGGQITLSVTTRNQGGGSADTSVTGFYISSNWLVDASDIRIQETQEVPPLGPGTSFTGTVIVTIPPNVTPGLYYLLATADVNDRIFETNEGNNAVGRSLAVGPDLAFSALSVPPTAVPGATFNTTYTVRNQGAGIAGASKLQFYWSTNYTLDGGDTPLGTVDIASLAAGTSQSGQITLTTPGGLGLGTYYVIAMIDAAKMVAEAWESNNISYVAVRVGGDLVISAFTAPVAIGAGASFEVSDTTKNSGSLEIAPSVTHFYLSSDAGLSSVDTLVGTRSVGRLLSGEASAGKATITIPAGTAIGSYYLFAKADGPDAVPETLDNNNAAIRSVTVGPDLVASITSATTPVRAGSTTVVNDTITNRGGNDAAATIVKYYLSTNYMLDTGDTPFADTRPVPALPTGTSNSASISLTIPAGMAAGYYYVLAQADGGGSVTESSETNNIAQRFIRVE